jgi:hypothetical protein
MNSAIFYNPFVVLHEFYHHLRARSGPHRGTERHANAFARRFIDSYVAVIKIALEKSENSKKAGG